jgi:hypothetical protein
VRITAVIGSERGALFPQAAFDAGAGKFLQSPCAFAQELKDTGLRRTWPNMISREGARGEEYNAWARPTNPPEHTIIIPFTRMLGGPMDFTPGIFDVAHGQQDVSRRVQSTWRQAEALRSDSSALIDVRFDTRA